MPDAFEYEDSVQAVSAWRLKANGLRVLLVNQGIAPVATVMLTYLVGSGDEQEGQTGATHFLEHMMFKGSARFNRAEGRDVFELMQRLGAHVNATTSVDRTNYFVTLPVDHLPLALEIESDRLRNLLLNEADVRTERTVILDELDRTLNDPVGHLFQQLWRTAFTRHSYGHPVIGWRRDVEQMSRDELRRFYDTFYWPENATLTLVGPLEAEHTLDTVARHFAHLPCMPAIPERPRVAEQPQHTERRIRHTGPGQITVLMMGYRSCASRDDDAAALELLGRILAAGKNSRLWRRLTDRGLAAEVSAGALSTRDPGLFHIMTLLVPQVPVQSVEKEIDAAIAELQANGPLEDELSRARGHLVARDAFARDGSYGLAAALNEAIAAGDWRLFASRRERLEAVTASDVQRAACKYLQPGQRTVAVLVPGA